MAMVDPIADMLTRIRNANQRWHTHVDIPQSRLKLEILKKLLDNGETDLEEILIGYKHFYQNELANKSHVLNSLQDGLAILLTNTLK